MLRNSNKIVVQSRNCHLTDLIQATFLVSQLQNASIALGALGCFAVRNVSIKKIVVGKQYAPSGTPHRS